MTAARSRGSAALAGAVLCVALAAAHAPRAGRAAMDGFVTREEALEIVRTPLERTVGRDEAERVRRVAVANALLEHCGLDWDRLFRALAAHHRHRLRRPEAEMSRITVWHGAWQGQALALLRRDRPVCDEDLRRATVRGAARRLVELEQEDGGA